MLMQLARDQLKTLSNQIDVFLAVANDKIQKLHKYSKKAIQRYSISNLLAMLSEKNLTEKMPDPLDHTFVFMLNKDILAHLEAWYGIEVNLNQDEIGTRSLVKISSKISRFKEHASDPQLFRAACQDANYCDPLTVAVYRQTDEPVVDVGNTNLMRSASLSLAMESSFHRYIAKPNARQNTSKTTRESLILFSRPMPNTSFRLNMSKSRDLNDKDPKVYREKNSRIMYVKRRESKVSISKNVLTKEFVDTMTQTRRMNTLCELLDSDDPQDRVGLGNSRILDSQDKIIDKTDTPQKDPPIKRQLPRLNILTSDDRSIMEEKTPAKDNISSTRLNTTTIVKGNLNSLKEEASESIKSHASLVSARRYPSKQNINDQTDRHTNMFDNRRAANVCRFKLKPRIIAGTHFKCK